MNETTRTLVFVCLAAASAGLATLTYVSNKPPQAAGFELVGQPFFDQLTSAAQVTGLELAALGDKGNLESFQVRKTDGLWRIPSHYDYPAEAAERLAQTTTAMIGLHREALAGRLKTDHARLGVLDPKDPDVDDPEQTGKRLTLKGEGGTVVADFIIGKQVEREEKENVEQPFDNSNDRPIYYVRRADETQTYMVPLEISLSTRFSDWIDTKLLPVEANQISRVKIDNYDLVNNPRDPLGVSRIKQVGDRIELLRPDGFGEWEMAGLDPTLETLKTAEVNTLVQTLSSLKIVGVRPKFKYRGQSLIGPDLKLTPPEELKQDPQTYNEVMTEMQVDLAEKGLYLQAVNGDINQLELISESGELRFSTTEGVAYTLDFGKAIEGDTDLIEIGQPTANGDEKEPSTADGDVDAADAETAEAGEASAPENDKSPSGKNRYVLIRVAVDPEAIGEGVPLPPTPPTEPTKPDGYVPAEKPEPDPSKQDSPTPPDSSGATANPGRDLPPDPTGGGTEENNNAPAPTPETTDAPQSETTAPGSQAESGTSDSPTTEDSIRSEDKPPVTSGDSTEDSGSGDDEDSEQDLEKSEAAEQQGESKEDAMQESERNPLFVEYERALEQYEQDKTQYEIDLSRFERQKKEHEEQVKAAQERVDILNERFGAWYYVVSSANLGQLRLEREALVEPAAPNPLEPKLEGPDTSVPPIPQFLMPPEPQGETPPSDAASRSEAANESEPEKSGGEPEKDPAGDGSAVEDPDGQ